VQSQFLKVDGKPRPGPARLDIVRMTGSGWREVVVEDPDSNVFHKAMAYEAPDGRKGLVTVGAMKAMLKFWWFDGEWKNEVMWDVSFGGKFDRLRDVEIGDVNGDGKNEIVIATHDQGVIAVVSRDNTAWRIEEVARTPDTFVHEIEIGDVDGDGKLEFYATPSMPNVVGKSQSGEVVQFVWDGSAYKMSVVEKYETRHVKEILVADLDGDGTSTLFSVVEAELKKTEGTTRIEKPVEIRRFVFEGGAATSTVIATIQDAQCRFLTWGDVDGDGRSELLAAAMKTGLWLLRSGADGKWTAENFDEESSGYEHSAIIADLDGDGLNEIYVAADDQRQLNRYICKDGKLEKETIAQLPEDVITWNLMPAKL
ncbi:MAG: VCBS repeat-containing protein, partial [Deltaproteobacteria bacterium]|nr:VCBS repeat-containing protein [Deltaproteobacteria bacterium]